LVLLDEPEETAKALGIGPLCLLLFAIANGIIHRESDFGVFLSIPENLFATIQRTLPALSARLDERHCMPRLRDLYGPDFPRVLWSRFVGSFDLSVQESAVVLPETLDAIGQVASSERGDLAFGPRTVVSAFNRMVAHYIDTKEPYSVADFVEDCLADEIMVALDYRTKVRECLHSPGAEAIPESALMTLCGFPNGIAVEPAQRLGLSRDTLETLRNNGVVYKRGTFYGLNALQKQEAGAQEGDELRDTIEEILEEYAPSSRAFEIAKKAFTESVLPVLFERRQGYQLLGWEKRRDWMPFANGLVLAEFVGAFRQTERDFPRRLVAVAVGELGTAISLNDASDGRVDSGPELVVHFSMRWQSDRALPSKMVQVATGKPGNAEPGYIGVALDLLGEPMLLPLLDEFSWSPKGFLRTPFAIMYLIGEMGSRKLSHESEAQWSAIEDQVVRELITRFFADPVIRTQASESLEGVLPGSATDLLGVLSLNLLRKRYPAYVTLMRRPQWEKKVGDYINALNNQTIPMSAKRGREAWKTSKQEASHAFGSNPMNLEDLFSGYESIIEIKTGGRREDPATVNFKVHPFEQNVADFIVKNSAVGKMKVDDKECWWVPFNRAKSLLLDSGYLDEEISLLVEMGKSRGMFSARRHKNSPVLYCVPLDPDMMKARLREKLADLAHEIGELSRLPDYRSTFDTDGFAQEIDQVQDDVQYDSLLSKIHRQFESDHDRLPHYDEKLVECFMEIVSQVEKDKRAVSPQQMASLQAAPIGASPWCSDLTKYILPNLRNLKKETLSDCDKIQREASQASVKYKESSGSPMERIAVIQEGYQLVGRLRLESPTVQDRIKELCRRFDEYERWRVLLKQSDELYNSLLEMKKDEVHETMVNGLLADFEGVSKAISEHLSLRNVGGLGSYNQFGDQMKTIDSRRKTYLVGLKTVFEQEKARLNAILKDMELAGTPHIAEAFDPTDSKSSYDRLYSKGSEMARASLESDEQDLSAQRLEVIYARDVLKRIEKEAAERVLLAIAQAEATIGQLSKLFTPESLNQMVTTEADEHMPEEVKTQLLAVRAVCREARTAVRTAQEGVDVRLTVPSETMMGFIQKGTATDLKQLILRMMEEPDGSSDVLEVALASLSELFRRNKIQVKVELVNR
jgi:hypothetical protein